MLGPNTRGLKIRGIFFNRKVITPPPKGRFLPLKKVYTTRKKKMGWGPPFSKAPLLA